MNFFENMENPKNNKPQEGELELEMHAGPIKEEKRPMTPEEIHKHKMNFINESPTFSLKTEKPKTTKEQIEEVAKAIPPSIQAMVGEKVREIEKNKDNSFLQQSSKVYEQEKCVGDMGHLMMLENKMELAKKIIAESKNSKEINEATRELELTQKEYEQLFKEIERNKKESLNK